MTIVRNLAHSSRRRAGISIFRRKRTRDMIATRHSNQRNNTTNSSILTSRHIPLGRPDCSRARSNHFRVKELCLLDRLIEYMLLIDNTYILQLVRQIENSTIATRQYRENYFLDHRTYWIFNS
jgi:hypothetical protein